MGAVTFRYHYVFRDTNLRGFANFRIAFRIQKLRRVLGVQKVFDFLVFAAVPRLFGPPDISAAKELA